MVFCTPLLGMLDILYSTISNYYFVIVNNFLLLFLDTGGSMEVSQNILFEMKNYSNINIFFIAEVSRIFFVAKTTFKILQSLLKEIVVD